MSNTFEGTGDVFSQFIAIFRSLDSERKAKNKVLFNFSLIGAVYSDNLKASQVQGSDIVAKWLPFGEFMTLVKSTFNAFKTLVKGSEPSFFNVTIGIPIDPLSKDQTPKSQVTAILYTPLESKRSKAFAEIPEFMFTKVAKNPTLSEGQISAIRDYQIDRMAELFKVDKAKVIKFFKQFMRVLKGTYIACKPLDTGGFREIANYDKPAKAEDDRDAVNDDEPAQKKVQIPEEEISPKRAKANKAKKFFKNDVFRNIWAKNATKGINNLILRDGDIYSFKNAIGRKNVDSYDDWYGVVVNGDGEIIVMTDDSLDEAFVKFVLPPPLSDDTLNKMAQIQI